MKRYVAAAARQTYDSEGLVAAIKELLKTIAHDFGCEEYEITRLHVTSFLRQLDFTAMCDFKITGVVTNRGSAKFKADLKVPGNVDIPIDYYSSDSKLVKKLESELTLESGFGDLSDKYGQLYAEFVDIAERAAAEYGCTIDTSRDDSHRYAYSFDDYFWLYVDSVPSAHGVRRRREGHNCIEFPNVGEDVCDCVALFKWHFRVTVDPRNTDTIDEVPIYEFFDKLSATVEAADVATDEISDTLDQSAEYCAKFESDLAEYDIECRVRLDHTSVWVHDLPSVITPKYVFEIYHNGQPICRPKEFEDYSDIDWAKLKQNVVRNLKRKAAKANAPAPAPKRYRRDDADLI